jgi:uncharacterized cupredoxin-like copper-binding protein
LVRKGLAFGFVLIGILAGCAAQQPGPVSTPTTSLQPQSVDWKAAKEVEVDLTEFHIDPAMLDFEAMHPYRITFRNLGTLAHNFTSTGFFSAVLLRPDAPGTPSAAKGQIELTPGVSTVVELVPIKPGHYSFACTHPLHETFGMSGEAVIR